MMSEHRFAYFVKRPRRIEELMQPHPVEREREFEVVKTVRLAKIDYENFITDMVADRQFLEDNAALCGTSGRIVRCLKVTRKSSGESVLVVPDRAWVELAAYYQEND